MKLIVAGSRNFTDKDKIYDIINDSGFDITEIVSGGAVGVDKVAENWAKDHGVPVKSFVNEDRSPLVRNELMADYADGLLAIWKDQSIGTYHMITCMTQCKKPKLIKVINV